MFINEVCQFTCERSVVSPQTHCINVSGFSHPPIKTDRHHITEKLLNMAKNDKQTNKHRIRDSHEMLSLQVSRNLEPFEFKRLNFGLYLYNP
jgi:hypothetical protein